MKQLDRKFKSEIKKLHQLTVYGRWLFVLGCWLTLGTAGIWGLRQEFSLWLEDFTWIAVRYGLYYNRFSSICLATCIGVTAAVLTWQSRNILQGIPQKEIYRLKQQVKKIRATGPAHPLWKWVCKS
ncbi:MAG: hypothetical protein QNJ38_00575 [Prochloraceae cyanobacterium]|nr:hypothetical protein [Prochloraceae cyanobacterium]